jgi:SAM-dependent methyltransferase
VAKVKLGLPFSEPMHFDLDNLAPDERSYIESVLPHAAAFDLRRLWTLVDDAWRECQCDHLVMDERIDRFYAHPVWLLNGLFTEYDEESIRHRRAIANFVSGLAPRRVADFGGGYGSLARLIGSKCPETEVHIIEPHPRSAGVARAEKTSNVRFVPDLQGEYDILIATDVFEHVPDPLSLVEHTAAHLMLGGEYVIANCFWPVVRCHLPATFHFKWSWDYAMAAMNLVPGRVVAYGRAYRRAGQVSAAAARKTETRSKRCFPIIERMPARLQGRVARLLMGGVG